MRTKRQTQSHTSSIVDASAHQLFQPQDQQSHHYVTDVFRNEHLSCFELAHHLKISDVKLFHVLHKPLPATILFEHLTMVERADRIRISRCIISDTNKGSTNLRERFKL